MLEFILTHIDAEKLTARIEKVVVYIDNMRATSPLVARCLESFDDSVAKIVLWAMGHKDLTL